jgi:hypothetical protein
MSVVLSSVVAGRNLPAADANGLSDVSDIGATAVRVVLQKRKSA